MARSCDICGRTSLKAVRRSHSNIGTIHRQHVNLQRKKIADVSLLLCTKCIKTVKKKVPALLGSQTKK